VSRLKIKTPVKISAGSVVRRDLILELKGQFAATCFAKIANFTELTPKLLKYTAIM
jgi:hypothetical protein